MIVKNRYLLALLILCSCSMESNLDLGLCKNKDPIKATLKLFNWPGLCTSFYIDETHILTAKHCVKRDNITIPNNKVIKVIKHKQLDVAILKTKNKNSFCVPLSLMNLNDGDYIVSVGFSRDYKDVFYGEIVGLESTDIVMNTGNTYGDSGGPVMFGGYVVGIMYSSDGVYAYATRINSIFLWIIQNME